jgi:hypothetical protein
MRRAGRGAENSATPPREAAGETQLGGGWPLMGRCAAMKVGREGCTPAVAGQHNLSSHAQPTPTNAAGQLPKAAGARPLQRSGSYTDCSTDGLFSFPCFPRCKLFAQVAWRLGIRVSRVLYDLRPSDTKRSLEVVK